MTSPELDTGDAKIRPVVFISYRRSDSQAWARLIADFLTTRSNVEVLLDVDTIERGADYTREIESQVAKADAVLVIIGVSWLSATDSNGRPRLTDPGDAVLQEVTSALSQDKVVVPVLVDGAAIPSHGSLPSQIADLAHRNGIALKHESFRQDAAHLVVDLRGIGARLLSENAALAAASRYAPVAARRASEGLVRFKGGLSKQYEKRKAERAKALGIGQKVDLDGIEPSRIKEEQTSRHCAKCGTTLPPGAAFCNGCGEAVDTPDAG